jgi:hypothetical protein
MDDAEIERLRKEICRSFNSSPHKKKYWLALLEMHAGVQLKRRQRERKEDKESSVRSDPASAGGR